MTHVKTCAVRAWMLLALTLGAATPARAADPVLVQPNDNRHAAGHLADGTLTLTLRAARGVWTPEGPDGPNVTIDAIGVTVRADAASVMTFQRSPRSVPIPSDSRWSTRSGRFEKCAANRACTDAQKTQPLTRDAAAAASSRSARGSPSATL